MVNDAGFEVWRQYTVRAWPTLMFVDPAGKVIGKHEGEIQYEAFDRLIGEMVAEFDAEGGIDRRPIHFVTEREKEAARAPLLSRQGARGRRERPALHRRFQSQPDRGRDA